MTDKLTLAFALATSLGAPLAGCSSNADDPDANRFLTSGAAEAGGSGGGDTGAAGGAGAGASGGAGGSGAGTDGGSCNGGAGGSGGVDTDASAGGCSSISGTIYGKGTVRKLYVDGATTSYCPGDPYMKVYVDFVSDPSDSGPGCVLLGAELTSIGGTRLTQHCVTDGQLHCGDVINLSYTTLEKFNWYTPSPATYDMCYHEGQACGTPGGLGCDGGVCPD